MKLGVNKEYHVNGKLMYETVFETVAPLFEKNFNAIKNEEHGAIIRTGWTRRYWNNGKMNWEIKYDEFGRAINGTFRAYRKDGTEIRY